MASYLLHPPTLLLEQPRLPPIKPRAPALAKRARGPLSPKPQAQHLVASQSTTLPRRSGNYPPTLWNNDYLQTLQSEFEGEEHVGRLEKLKAEARMLITEKRGTLEQLELVDALRQLGVAYHFEEEITNVLATISEAVDVDLFVQQHGLHAIALLFRLLRENGFEVSQDIFERFKDGNGGFKECLCRDTRGLLSLYEASYVAKEGESTMDDAREFATKHLEGIHGSSLDPWLKEHVCHALELPLNWRFQRWHTKWFIDMCERGKEINLSLLELAKLDFNIVQSKYKSEIRELARWWADLDLLGDKFSFSRDRLVESYLWAVGWSFEPKYWRCREVFTKAICFITAIDDIYDVYGSLEEVELFTKAVERWDVNALHELPEYMKICLLALFNTFNEIAYKILKEKGVDIIPYIKEGWTNICKAFLIEARWYHKGYTPTLEEYLDNAGISVSQHLSLTLAYCVNDYVSVEALRCFDSYYDTIYTSGIVARLYDDLGTTTAEHQRGDVSKSIHCFMHERGCSEEKALEHIRDMITDYWKKIYSDRKASTRLEKYFKDVVINHLQTMQFFYQHGDGYGMPQHETKERIMSLLIQPILL